MKKNLLLPSLLGAAVASLAIVQSVGAAGVTFDDFNVNNGHFTSTPATGSGSSQNIGTSSTAVRVTTDSPLEGVGQQRLTLIPTTVGNSMRLRHLSGGGSAANNIAFTTTDGTDGWIGLYLRADPTNDPNWTVSIWVEGSGANNYATRKTIITDGQWHLYEWNLDDFSGGDDGWGDISSGILTGSATVNNGSHTIDSIIFRNASGPEATVLFMDYVAYNPNGSIANLLGDPCLATPGVLINGPVAVGRPVQVIGVVSNATKVTIYQDSGPSGTMVALGSKTTGLVAGNNEVAVSGLVKGARIAATQTVNGQESCMPTSLMFVGGGANPGVRVAFTIRETSSTGPIGDPGDVSSGNLHFYGASYVNGGAPGNAPVLTPSTNWQTVSFTRGLETIGDPASAAAAFRPAATGYNPNDWVSIQVYAFRTLHDDRVYSTVAPTVPDLSSNTAFGVNWTWTPVSGAEGYRLLRSYNWAGYVEYVDVTGTNFLDTNALWQAGYNVEPKTTQTSGSVRWNPSLSNTNSLPGDWGIFESINFVIDPSGDTGPFDLYIDNLQNGSTVFQSFESAEVGTNCAFRDPGFSGSTSGSILSSPSSALVSDLVGDNSSKSLRVQFQWSGTNSSKWLRLTTSGMGNPMVDLNQPISLRVLLLPVGSSVVPPVAPHLTISFSGGKAVLNWDGTHQLQAAPAPTGPFTSLPGATNAPFTDNNTLTTPARFFRLTD